MSLPLLIARSHDPAPPPPPPSTTLLIGFFEDGQFQTNDATFLTSINDLKDHDLNSFLFTANTGSGAVSDAAGDFQQIYAPMSPLYALYPSSATVVSDAAARAVIEPIAATVAAHASIIGINIRDDAARARNAQFQQQLRIFAETLPSTPISPLMVMTGRSAWEVWDIIQPLDFMGYNFPFKQDTAPFEFFRNYKQWWLYLREQFQLKPQAYPLWLVLQGHETVNSVNPDPSSDLRQPSAEEITAEMWMAFGEEANGIFLYTYNNSQGNLGLSWTGIKNLPTQYAAIGVEAPKLFTLDTTYRVQSSKYPDRFKTNSRNYYISTFKNSIVPNTYYVVVVNPTNGSVNIQVTSDWFSGTLHDLLTAQDYALGANIPFTKGQGRMFVLNSFAALTPPAPATNKVTNGDFETASGGLASNWTGSLPVDTSQHHSGTQSAHPGTGNNTYSQTITSQLAADTEYYWSFWEKHSGLSENSNVGMRIEQLSPTITPSELSDINWKMCASSDWRKLCGWFRTPASGTAWRMDIVTNLGAGENIWFDDVTLARADTYALGEYLEERITPDSGATTFRPSDFGSITGTNATTDQGLIQQAIDAAVAFDAPCRVDLGSHTYAVGARGGIMNIGANRNIAYGWRIPELAHDITFDATTAHFTYTQVPSLTSVNSYILFQIGQGWDIDVDGAWVGGSDPNFLTPIIRYAENITVSMSGAVWDSSLLSNSNLTTLSGGVVGGCIQFSACLNCALDGLHLDKSYGHTAGVGCNTWTRYLTVTNCLTDLAYEKGYWFDGAWDSVFDNLDCTAFVNTSTPVGVQLAANTDNRRISERNEVKNCTLSGVHTGISVQGNTNNIHDNAITLLNDNVTHRGIEATVPVSSDRGSWEVSDNNIHDNTITRPGSSPSAKGYGIYLEGRSTSFIGGPLRVLNTTVTGNVIGDTNRKMGYLVVFSVYAVNNSITGNTYYNSEQADVSGGTATGNTVSGNTHL